MIPNEITGEARNYRMRLNITDMKINQMVVPVESPQRDNILFNMSTDVVGSEAIAKIGAFDGPAKITLMGTVEILYEKYGSWNMNVNAHELKNATR